MTQQKSKVYAITVSSPLTQANIAAFAQAYGIRETTAVLAVVERYFRLSFKQRQKIEERIEWELHRNRGFRRITTFCRPKQAKRAAASGKA